MKHPISIFLKPIQTKAIGLAEYTHLQIAVHDPSRILGYFHHRDEHGRPRKFK